MSHLTLEALARLLDEPPTAEEAAHLDACADCRAELEQLRDDVQSLSMLPDVAPAPDAWATLERRLTDEGLIRSRHSFAVRSTRLLQIAAAVVLFLGGTLAGRMSAGTADTTLARQTPPVQTASSPPLPSAAPEPQTPAASTQLAASDDSSVVPEDPAPPTRPAPRRAPSVTLASNNFAPGYQAATMDEAIAVLREAEELYLAALTRYAELATNADAGDPVSRLAALQSIVMTTQAALSQTPMDPVINGYHLTALAQRDAALRQVAAVTGDRVF